MAINRAVEASRPPMQSSQTPSYHGPLTVAAVQVLFLIMALPAYFISRSFNDGFYVTIVLGVAAMLVPMAIVVGGIALFRNRRQPWNKRKNLILVWFSINLLPVAFYVVSGAVFQLFFPGGVTSPDYIGFDGVINFTASVITT